MTLNPAVYFGVGMENNSRPSLNLDLPGAGPPDPGGNEQLNWLQLGIGSQSASGDIVALQHGVSGSEVVHVHANTAVPLQQVQKNIGADQSSNSKTPSSALRVQSRANSSECCRYCQYIEKAEGPENNCDLLRGKIVAMTSLLYWPKCKINSKARSGKDTKLDLWKDRPPGLPAHIGWGSPSNRSGRWGGQKKRPTEDDLRPLLRWLTDQFLAWDPKETRCCVPQCVVSDAGRDMLASAMESCGIQDNPSDGPASDLVAPTTQIALSPSSSPANQPPDDPNFRNLQVTTAQPVVPLVVSGFDGADTKTPMTGTCKSTASTLMDLGPVVSTNLPNLMADFQSGTGSQTSHSGYSSQCTQPTVGSQFNILSTKGQVLLPPTLPWTNQMVTLFTTPQIPAVAISHGTTEPLTAVGGTCQSIASTLMDMSSTNMLIDDTSGAGSQTSYNVDSSQSAPSIADPSFSNWSNNGQALQLSPMPWIKHTDAPHTVLQTSRVAKSPGGLEPVMEDNHAGVPDFVTDQSSLGFHTTSDQMMDTDNEPMDMDVDEVLGLLCEYFGKK